MKIKTKSIQGFDKFHVKVYELWWKTVKIEVLTLEFC